MIIEINIIDAVKAAFCTLIGWVFSVVFYFAPIHGLIIGMSISFAGSFLLGIIAGLTVQGESIDLKKAGVAFSEFANYLIILAALYTIGDKMQDSDWIYSILRCITWGMIYFYCANCTKNMKRIWSRSRFVLFMWYVLNLEFIKKYPILKKFEQYEKNKLKKHSKSDSGKME